MEDILDFAARVILAGVIVLAGLVLVQIVEALPV